MVKRTKNYFGLVNKSSRNQPRISVNFHGIVHDRTDFDRIRMETGGFKVVAYERANVPKSLSKGGELLA